MTSNPPQTNDLVYYDTNIWVAYMLGEKDRLHSKSEELITNIEKRYKIAIVSHLVLMETIHVLRTRIVQKSQVNDGSQINRDVNNATEKFIKLIRDLEISNKIIVAAPHKSIFEHQIYAFNHLRNYFGTKIYSSRRRKHKKQYRYVGLNHTDIEHACLAMYSKVSEFYSGDLLFEKLFCNPPFNSIRFEPVRPSSH